MEWTWERVVDGVRWRAEGVVASLPREARVWVRNQQANARIRRGETAFDRTRLIHTYQQALKLLLRTTPAAQLGDYLEFGVYHGTSMSCMYEARRALGLDHIRLFGFDSFEGLPDDAAREDGGLWEPGQFKSSIALTHENVRRWGVPPEAVTLVPGWFADSCVPATRARLGIERASVIMVDCDLYSSTRDVLAFCAPLIGRQAVMVFDDWHAGGLADKGMGEAKAFEEFLDAHRELVAGEIPGLNYKDKPDPMIFLVTRR